MLTLMQIPLFPEAASQAARNVDSLFFFLCALSAAVMLLLIVLIVGFSVKYRRRAPNQIGAPVPTSMKLELTWVFASLAASVVIFAWGVQTFFEQRQVPDGAIEIFGVGKQWMWKFQHLEGPVEINELHVPVDRDIKVVLTSEDVIHDFFVPAFRNKADVLPDRYSVVTFRPTEIGAYRLHCAEYCGTNHALMGGWVHVMQQSDYENWLAGRTGQPAASQLGAALFGRLECPACHSPERVAQGRAPSLKNLYGSRVQLASGDTVIADADYLLRSILYPQAEIVAGYGTSMPGYAGESKEHLTKLVIYIQSLSSAPDKLQVAQGAIP